MPNDVINTVTINGTAYGIGGGGHTIKNPAGTAMTQRSNLQFVDLTVSDDSTNDATKVESVHVIQSESELENLPDGLYMLDDDEDTVIDGNLVGYDNTTSDLNAENVQDAIDEVVETLDDKIDISIKGVANGVAELDSTGKVPSSQLPSFVEQLSETVNELGEYIGKNDFGQIISIKTYTSSNMYVFPSDGYLYVRCNESGSKIFVVIEGAHASTGVYIELEYGKQAAATSLFVKKGMRAYVYLGTGNYSCSFVPLV